MRPPSGEDAAVAARPVRRRVRVRDAEGGRPRCGARRPRTAARARAGRDALDAAGRLGGRRRDAAAGGREGGAAGGRARRLGRARRWPSTTATSADGRSGRRTSTSSTCGATCSADEPQGDGLETEEAAFFAVDELPELSPKTPSEHLAAGPRRSRPTRNAAPSSTDRRRTSVGSRPAGYLHSERAGSRSPSRTRSPPSSAGIGDGVLDSLRDRLGCTILLRGNRLTIEGDDDARRRGARGRRRARRARRGRPRDRAGHRRRRRRRARPGRGHPRRLRGRRLAPPRQEDRAEDGDAEALRRRDPRLHRHVRDRAGRHRQDLPRDGARRRRALGAAGRPDHPHAPRGRGRRAARLPPRRHAREGRSRTCARSSTRSTTCSTPTG